MTFHLRYFVAFIFLMFLLHEVHEWAHHIAGALLCGCTGTRDFVYWFLCDNCDKEKFSPFVSLAGPLVTYIFMWTGFFLLNKKNTVERKMTGFSLVFAALPFPRLLSLLDRGGDELVAMRQLFSGHESFKGEGVLIGALVVLLCTIPPLWRAYRVSRIQHWLFAALIFFLLFSAIDNVSVAALNHLEHTGFLHDPLIFGTPLLVWVWDVLLVVGFLLTRKDLMSISRKDTKIRRDAKENFT